MATMFVQSCNRMKAKFAGIHLHCDMKLETVPFVSSHNGDKTSTEEASILPNSFVLFMYYNKMETIFVFYTMS
jgi:hypothetical protein